MRKENASMSGASELTSMAIFQGSVAARGKTLPNAGFTIGLKSRARTINVNEKTALRSATVTVTMLTPALDDEPAVGGSQHCAANDQV